MLKKLYKDEVYSTKTFGCFCPYWLKTTKSEVYISECFDEIINILPIEERDIDPVAVCSLLHFNYIHGNRTLVKGINKIPWRATLTSNGIIYRNTAIPHNCIYEKPKDIALKLKKLLLDELFKYIRGYSNIYILLSGGLDSRVTAGLLKILQEKISFNVTAVTWGLDYSRDVVYAKDISKLYNWKFIHIPINSEVLKRNIFESVFYCGAEIAGIHLHGEGFFKNLTKKDLVLASSFGDSIGRGEFSGQKLKNITFQEFKNVYGLIYPDIYKQCIPRLENDRKLAFENAKCNEYWALCELDLQENYMRRMLVHVMGYIRQWTNLEQVFTSDEVIRYIWSLSPECRNDEIYKELFKIIDMNLYSMPWARTGVAFNGTREKNNKLTKDFHEYNKWAHNDLHLFLDELINNGELNNLNIFNMDKLKRLWNLWSNNQRINSEIILKLAGIEILSKKYNLKAVKRNKADIIKYRFYRNIIEIPFEIAKYNLKKYLFKEVL